MQLIAFDCQYHEKYNCIRVDLQDYQYFIFAIGEEPTIYMKESASSKTWISLLKELKPQLKQQYVSILLNFLSEPKQSYVQTIQNYGDNIILQIVRSNQRKSLIIPIVQLAQSQQLLINIEDIRLMSHRQQGCQQKNLSISQTSQEQFHKEIIEQQVDKNNEQQTLFKQQVTEQIIKQDNTFQIESNQKQGLIYEFSQSEMRESYKKQQQKYENLQKKYQQLQQDHKELTLRLLMTEQRQKQLLKNAQTSQQRYKEEGKQKYILHNFNDYQKITIMKKDNEKQQNFIREQKLQNTKSLNYDKYKNSYNNQFTDYYENSKNKKPTINADGFNEFAFSHFSLGKYGNCFEVKDKNIIKFREADVFGNYYQMPSFDTIPLQGKTKVIFKLIKSKSNNIHVGILLTIRKRFRYSIHQENLISYKLKGGKYALHQDGDPAKIDCQQIKPGQSLQMIVDRETNTIQFKKNISIRRQMPQRFKKADLFPFVTMKDIGDQIQIL